MAYKRVRWRRTTLAVTPFSISSLLRQSLGEAGVPIKPYLHLQCKAARGISPPSNQFPILLEAVQDRAGIRRIGPCFRLWP